MRNKKPVNVNLGCGTNLVKGFVNIDVVRPSNADDSFLQGSATEIPLDTESVDYLLMDQVLEHIRMADIVPALYEMRRVLRKGGRAVIIVPDFEDAVRTWLDARHNLSFNPLAYQYHSEVIYGNQLHEGEYHKAPMCAGFLNYALNTVGLSKHEIMFYPTHSPVPTCPGIRPSPSGALCRNAQLFADIIKTS